jgi:hypothetical protein
VVNVEKRSVVSFVAALNVAGLSCGVEQDTRAAQEVAAVAQFGTPSALDTLLELNREYIRSVQQSDVARFRDILADDFRCSIPDGSIVDKAGFLDQTARPVTVRSTSTFVRPAANTQ